MQSNARYVAEPKVDQSIIDAFERKYSSYLDMSRDDDKWRNTWRYKHHGIQSLWKGWRDAHIAMSEDVSTPA